MTFDPKKHLIRIQGNRDYLPVAARLIWFRQDHPDWGIQTQPVELNTEKQYAIFSCSILNAEGRLMATATKMENVRGFADYIEKAETGAVGRALAYVGYGTQFAPELEEAERFADAPRSTGGTVRDSRRVGNSAFQAVADRQGEQSTETQVTAAPAAAARPTARARGPQSDPATGALHRCSADGCPNVLTASQVTMTVKRFGQPLCLMHQKSATLVNSTENGRGNYVHN